MIIASIKNLNFQNAQPLTLGMEVHPDNTSTGDRVSSSQKKKKNPQTIVHNTGQGAHKIIHIVPEVIQGMGENCIINNYRVGCIQCSIEI